MDNNTQDAEMEMEREMEAALADFEEVGAEPASAPAEAQAHAQAQVQASAPQAATVEAVVASAPAADPVPGERPLTALYELMLPVTIELGRTRMSVQEVLQLARGSVVELDRLAGEPVDIFVGDRRFAEGEVVVLGENFGVRITRLIPPSGSAEAA